MQLIAFIVQAKEPKKDPT